jgi:L-ascorbate metabolism protein UlaG (beta-lactamase superfamily)
MSAFKFKIFYLIIFLIPNFALGDYKNTNGKAIKKPLKDLLKWQLNKAETNIEIIDISDDWKNFDLNEHDNYFIWIGHSTFLIKKRGITILSDPVFSERASPLKNFGPKRLIPPAIPIKSLPAIDIVTISHNHYDHLDMRSLKKIYDKNLDTIFLIPMGDKDIFDNANIGNTYEFIWWDAINISGLEFTFTPVQHWSARGIFDRNDSLWGGWFIKDEDYSIYHAGDTGYSNDFKATRAKLGSPKYAFIPIGAYDPEWFMSESHVNPEEAVVIARDLNATYSYGMHWGTFTLTSEDTTEPKERLENILIKDNPINFKVISPGNLIDLE